jgi:hypothetical protein
MNLTEEDTASSGSRCVFWPGIGIYFTCNVSKGERDKVSPTEEYTLHLLVQQPCLRFQLEHF